MSKLGEVRKIKKLSFTVLLNCHKKKRPKGKKSFLKKKTGCHFGEKPREKEKSINK